MASVKGELIPAADPRELFDRGLEQFVRGRAAESVASLREAFFGNLFIAPLLLGRPVEASGLWVPGPSGSPEAAREYAREKRKSWQAISSALRYLRCLWDDPLVRREIRSYTNFCKSYSRSQQGTERLTAELMGERRKFTNQRRIASTQKEILKRIRAFRFDLPPALPELATVTLATAEADQAAEFLKRVLGAPLVHHQSTRSWSLTFGKLTVRIVTGETASSGLELTLKVNDFDYYLHRIEDEEIVPVSSQTAIPRTSYLLIEAPGGFRLRLVPGGEAE
jgi:hypothetical protein